MTNENRKKISENGREILKNENRKNLVNEEK